MTIGRVVERLFARHLSRAVAGARKLIRPQPILRHCTPTQIRIEERHCVAGDQWPERARLVWFVLIHGRRIEERQVLVAGQHYVVNAAPSSRIGVSTKDLLHGRLRNVGPRSNCESGRGAIVGNERRRRIAQERSESLVGQ